MLFTSQKTKISIAEFGSQSPQIRERRLNYKPLVLIAEDDEDSRFLLKYVLEESGYGVEEVADGESAVRICESCQPDIILMDARLPEVDGFTATRRIRAKSDFLDTPIIFVSAAADSISSAAAFAAGANDFVIKPYAIEKLRAVIAKHAQNLNERKSLIE